MDYPGHFKDEASVDAQRAVKDWDLLFREEIKAGKAFGSLNV